MFCPPPQEFASRLNNTSVSASFAAGGGNISASVASASSTLVGGGGGGGGSFLGFSSSVGAEAGSSVCSTSMSTSSSDVDVANAEAADMASSPLNARRRNAVSFSGSTRYFPHSFPSTYTTCVKRSEDECRRELFLESSLSGSRSISRMKADSFFGPLRRLFPSAVSCPSFLLR